jgi:hypothetical protein
MNEYDIDDAELMWAGAPDHPHLAAASRTLRNLKDAVNAKSDGWPYWKRPRGAAGQLMRLVEGDVTARQRGYDRDDIAAKDVRKAYSALKSFRTVTGIQFEIVEV